MAQKMIDLMKDSKKKIKTVATQTGINDEFCIYLTNNKTIRVFYSKSYKQYVISFNFGNCVKYIITQDMWFIFKNHFDKIETIFKNNIICKIK